MSLFQVRRGGFVMLQNSDLQEAEKEFEALVKRHPQSAICLVKVDFIKTNPAQQVVNQKRGVTHE